MRSPLLVLIALAALVIGLAAARGMPRGDEARTVRFEVLAHADPGDVYAGDVYWHRDHAYLSSHKGRDSCPAQGVRVYDLRNPRSPRRVARFAAVPGSWTEKTIVRRVRTAAFTGDLAVTSFQSCGAPGFQGYGLYDVTNPRRPRELARVRTMPRGSHEIWLQPTRGRAYVYTAIIASEIRSSPDGERPGQADFRIVDVTNPRRPRDVGEWGAWKALGIRPMRDGGAPLTEANLVHSVIGNASGTRAYLSYWDLGTVILDVSNPSQPRYLGRTPRTENAHSAALGRNETLLIETHETDGGTPTLYDISNPAAPQRLSEFELPRRVLDQGRRGDLQRVATINLSDSVHDPKISGNRAYFSWYRQGVVVADISNPRRPRLVARFLPKLVRDREKLFCPDRSCRAVWGVYVTPRGYVVASDMLSGLWVLRLR